MRADLLLQPGSRQCPAQPLGDGGHFPYRAETQCNWENSREIRFTWCALAKVVGHNGSESHQTCMLIRLPCQCSSLPLGVSFSTCVLMTNMPKQKWRWESLPSLWYKSWGTVAELSLGAAVWDGVDVTGSSVSPISLEDRGFPSTSVCTPSKPQTHAGTKMLQKHNQFAERWRRASKCPAGNKAQLPISATEPWPWSATRRRGPLGSGLAPGLAPQQGQPGAGQMAPSRPRGPLFWERAPLRLQQQHPGSRADGLLAACGIIASAGYFCSQRSLLFVPLWNDHGFFSPFFFFLLPCLVWIYVFFVRCGVRPGGGHLPEGVDGRVGGASGSPAQTDRHLNGWGDCSSSCIACRSGLEWSCKEKSWIGTTLSSLSGALQSQSVCCTPARLYLNCFTYLSGCSREGASPGSE